MIYILKRNGGLLFVLTLAFLLGLKASSGEAADLSPPATNPPVQVFEERLSGFFIKLGFTYAINTTDSHLYSQLLPLAGAPKLKIPGVRGILDNVATLGFESGYYVTPNVSIDLSGGIPMYAKVKTKHPFPPGGLPVPSGTTLTTVMPAIVPLTVVYHFDQFGRFQPYLGAGAAAVFSFSQKNGFSTGVRVNPTIGVVFQGGADIMLDSHWGWSFDVKKVFAYGETDTRGLNLAVIGMSGHLPLQGMLKTKFQPWVVSTGLVYRF
jgi:outer membrane protein